MTNKESQNEFFNFDAPIIKEWEKEQALEQQPSGDLISRVDALASIKNLYPDMPIVDILGARRKWLEKYAPYFECENAIEQLPSVKPQTGHWEMPVQDDGMSDPIYYQVRCSKCGFDLDPQTWHMELHQYDADKYCPKCGAKMSENPTGSKDVIWYDKRNYSVIVVEPQERSE